MEPQSLNKNIESIYQNLVDQNFKSAEKQILELVQSIFTANTSDYLLLSSTVDKIYVEFEQEYAQWLSTKGYKTPADHTNDYTNCLIAHMTDPDAMDDLLFELSEYADHLPEPDNKEELEYQYMCYRKNLNKGKSVEDMHSHTSHHA
jgi:hypothetical protein